jgi:hypothetical protein
MCRRSFRPFRESLQFPAPRPFLERSRPSHRVSHRWPPGCPVPRGAEPASLEHAEGNTSPRTATRRKNGWIVMGSTTHKLPSRCGRTIAGSGQNMFLRDQRIRRRSHAGPHTGINVRNETFDHDDEPSAGPTNSLAPSEEANERSFTPFLGGTRRAREGRLGPAP